MRGESARLKTERRSSASGQRRTSSTTRKQSGAGDDRRRRDTRTARDTRQTRSTAARDGRYGAQPRPRTSGSRQPPRKKRRRRRKKSFFRTFLRFMRNFLIVLLLMVVTGVAAFKLLVKPPEQLPPPQTSTSEQGGPDVNPGALQRREGVYNVLLAATDKDGTRTDTMMVMCYDVPNKKVGVVSVPRDSLIDRGKGKSAKLAYGAGGVEERRKDISNMLGIPIDYYVKVDLQGFVALVDYVGGVDFYVPCDMDYDDQVQDLSIHFKEGQQHLDGQAAMEVVRFRKNNNGKGGYSDVGRTKTQQQLLVALAKKVLAWNNITRINGFVKMFDNYVETDLRMSDMLWFASQAIYIDPASDVETATLKGRGDSIFRGQTYCYELNRTATVETVNRLLNPYVQELTLADMTLTKADKYMS